MLSPLLISAQEDNSSTTLQPQDASSTKTAGRFSIVSPTRAESELNMLQGVMPGKYGSPEPTSSKKRNSTIPSNDESTGREEPASTEQKRQSIVSQMRASLDNADKGGGGVVSNMNDFYKTQKAKRAGDHLKKAEAAQNLRSFRNLTQVGGSGKKDKAAPTASNSSNQAADRAAAAAYLAQSSQRSSFKMKSSSNESSQAADRAAAAVYLSQSNSPKSNVDPPGKHAAFRALESNSTNPKPLGPHAFDSKSPQKQQRPHGARLPKKTLHSDKENAVAELRASLEDRAQQTGVVVNLDEFYKNQRAKGMQDKKKRNEAAQLLHNYQALVAKRNGAKVDVEEFCQEQRAMSVVDRLEEEEAAQIIQEYQTQFCITEPEEIPSDKPVLVDYEDTDYRAFVFVVHEHHGMLLLHCTHKKKKGPHFQLPGGNIDEDEFIAAAQFGGDAQSQLYDAARFAAARELYEETGIDVRDDLDRLEPAALRSSCDSHDGNDEKHRCLKCQLKNKVYFLLSVTDNDFWSEEESDDETEGLVSGGPIGGYLQLKLSNEHSSFAFAKDPDVAAEMIRKHSGGSGSEALLMSMNRPSQQRQKGKDAETAEASAEKPLTVELEKDAETAEASAEKPSTVESSDRDAAGEIEHDVEVAPVEKQGDESTLLDESLETPVPVDLLPPPERKGLFSCWFCV